MDLSASNQLSKILDNESKMKKLYGDRAARNLIAAVSVLKAASTLADVPNVPPTRRHKLSGILREIRAINVTQSLRLLIKPIDGETEPHKIRRIELIEVTNYH